jgi:predicted transcriptional regulator
MSDFDLPFDERTARDSEQIAAVEQGLASLDSGRTVPYDDVRRWLLSWGTESELPPPVCG